MRTDGAAVELAVLRLPVMRSGSVSFCPSAPTTLQMHVYRDAKDIVNKDIRRSCLDLTLPLGSYPKLMQMLLYSILPASPKVDPSSTVVV
jgi:hypothetical protein